VLGAGHASTLKGPIQRGGGDSSERARRQGCVLGVEELLVLHGEAHVPPARVRVEPPPCAGPASPVTCASKRAAASPSPAAAAVSGGPGAASSGSGRCAGAGV
jgi:hypothetical protein